MAKKHPEVEVIDKDVVRSKRERKADYKNKERQKKTDGQKFNRKRARQRDSEISREEEYFYN